MIFYIALMLIINFLGRSKPYQCYSRLERSQCLLFLSLSILFIDNFGNLLKLMNIHPCYSMLNRCYWVLMCIRMNFYPISSRGSTMINDMIWGIINTGLILEGIVQYCLGLRRIIDFTFRIFIADYFVSLEAASLVMFQKGALLN